MIRRNNINELRTMDDWIQGSGITVCGLNVKSVSHGSVLEKDLMGLFSSKDYPMPAIPQSITAKSSRPRLAAMMIDGQSEGPEVRPSDRKFGSHNTETRY